jgi:hypothetical protein
MRAHGAGIGGDAVKMAWLSAGSFSPLHAAALIPLAAVRIPIGWEALLALPGYRLRATGDRQHDNNRGEQSRQFHFPRLSPGMLPVGTAPAS